MKYFIAMLSFIFMMPLWADATIHINNFTFSPADVTITTGETVTWVNDDPNIAYALNSNDYSIMSNNINYQQTYIKTFNTPGTYAYFCTSMPNMQGVITVQPINQYIDNTVKKQVTQQLKGQEAGEPQQ